MVPEKNKLPVAFKIREDNDLRQVAISLQTSISDELDSGLFILEVWETDQYTEYVAKTYFHIIVSNHTES